MAIDNEVDIVGLSILSGTHLVLAERMKEEMADRNLEIPWFVGGNIPAQDVEKLEETGATKAFATGSTVDEVVKFFNKINIKT